MLNEYISLKEQKVIVEQEKARLEQEKCRVQSLLQGMQSVMNAFNASSTVPVPTMISHVNVTKPTVTVPLSIPTAGSPPGLPMYSTPTIIPVSGPRNSIMERDKHSTPLTRMNKLAESDNGMNNSQVAGQPTLNRSSSPNCGANESTTHISGVVKCLFNQPQPMTPPQAVSPQSEKLTTPVDVSSTVNCSQNNTPQRITPTNCTIISTERVTVSPLKQVTCYAIETNHCISSCSPVKTCSKRVGKRDHVKSRLDFDGTEVMENVHKPMTNETSTSESEMDADLFDLDLPNLDALGANFSFSELLVDLDLGCDGTNGYPCEPTLATSGDALSGSSHESGNGNMGANQVMSEFSSTFREVFSEKDMNVQCGPDTVTSMKSITKCIKIVNPVKGRRGSLEQQGCSGMK
ncbi:hypothetical protein V6Z11_A01G249700 [Gossypium hirsutum]